MSTLSISLPNEQLQLVDNLVGRYEFANRSEFIRSILRFITHNSALVEKVATFPFAVPEEKSVSKIISDFKKTKKYSAAFIKDLEEGLLSSDYFIE